MRAPSFPFPKRRANPFGASALQAARRRATGVAVRELMDVMPALQKPAKWAVLRALIDLADPHLLLHPGDDLDIAPLLEALPPEFGIEAQRLLDRKRKDVDGKADREERRGR